MLPRQQLRRVQHVSRAGGCVDFTVARHVLDDETVPQIISTRIFPDTHDQEHRASYMPLDKGLNGQSPYPAVSEETIIAFFDRNGEPAEPFVIVILPAERHFRRSKSRHCNPAFQAETAGE